MNEAIRLTLSSLQKLQVRWKTTENEDSSTGMPTYNGAIAQI